MFLQPVPNHLKTQIKKKKKTPIYIQIFVPLHIL